MSFANRRFEIGLIYQHPQKSQLFLSIAAGTLISMHKGSVIKKKPRRIQYELKQGVEVEDLCAAWGVSLQQLDKITAQFLAPVRSQNANVKRRKGPKLSSDQEAALAKHRLTAKIVA